MLILEQKDIIYVDCSEDGTVANSELLYSGKQGSSSIVTTTSTTPVETTTECVVTTSNVEFGEDTKYTDSSTEQQEQLSELKAKGKLLFGNFLGKRKKFLGRLSRTQQELLWRMSATFLHQRMIFSRCIMECLRLRDARISLVEVV